MRSAVRHRPSASMIVALIALVVAMSGSAVAASHLVSGDKLIRKRTLSGNRLRRHTLTGTQINLKRLGTVPKARSAASAGHARTADTAGHATSADTAGHATSADSAGHATSADSAGSATNAQNATNASNAASLGGQPAASYLTTADRIGTNGVEWTHGTPSGRTGTLFHHGPFTVTMTCTTATNGDTTMTIDATSTEANSVMDSDTGVTRDTLDGFSLSSSSPQVSGGTYTLEAPSGAALVFSGSFGTNSNGVSNGCWANFAGTA